MTSDELILETFFLQGNLESESASDLIHLRNKSLDINGLASAWQKQMFPATWVEISVGVECFLSLLLRGDQQSQIT